MVPSTLSGYALVSKRTSIAFKLTISRISKQWELDINEFPISTHLMIMLTGDSDENDKDDYDQYARHFVTFPPHFPLHLFGLFLEHESILFQGLYRKI